MHIYGMWPWKVPKWPWFWAKVAVNAWRDLATLEQSALNPAYQPEYEGGVNPRRNGHSKTIEDQSKICCTYVI
jgi:hypothetical protein